MKTLLLLALYIFPHFICTAGVDCREIGGEVPVNISNSPYTILPNGSLCCPEYIGDSCKDEKTMATKCLGGLVYEPCHLCKTCAKLLGEMCGGHQNQYGRCSQGLECIATNKNATGICYVKANRIEGECCGGPYGYEGRCLPGLRCNVSEESPLEREDISGVCLNSSTAPGACFKNCGNRTNRRVCGNDGHWYDNKCVLRRQNCLIPKNRQPQKIRPAPDNSTCEHACKIDLEQKMNTLDARVVSYSNGVVNGSRATIVCKEGYISLANTQNMTLQCSSDGRGPANWVSVATKRDGTEELRSIMNIVCIPQEIPETTGSSDYFRNN